MKPANFASVYCSLYPELAEICRKHGYALAVHGSMARDFDIIGIPWVEDPSHPDLVLNEITSTYAIKRIDGDPKFKLHGRLAYGLCISFGNCFIDLSFMPVKYNSVDTTYGSNLLGMP